MARITDTLGNEREIEREYEIPTNISVEYMRFWGLYEAIRELLQNALDEMTEIRRVGEKSYIVIPPEVSTGPLEMVSDVKVTECHGKTIILDRGRGLSVRALIMGESIKKVPSRGRFGEGLKLASLIIAREGYRMTIETRDMIIEPYIKTVTLEGETLGLLSFKVYKATTSNWKIRGADIGTLISIEPMIYISLEDYIPYKALTAITTVMRTTGATSYGVINDMLEKDPDSLPPLLWINSGYVCEKNGVEKRPPCNGGKSIKVPNMVIEESVSKIYYRDILVTKELNYMYSYNFWSYIQAENLSRDRKYINKSWLDYEVGNIWENTGSKKMIGKMILEILAGSASAKAYEEFNMNLWYIDWRRQKLWKDLWEKLAGKAAVIGSTDALPELISLLNYNGFTVYLVPRNLSGLIRTLPSISDAVEKLKSEQKLYTRIDDSMLPENVLNNLNDIRTLNEWIYKRFSILKKILEKGNIQAVHTDKPAIYAYRYPNKALLMRNRIMYGHTDYSKKEIGISIDILGSSLIRSVGTYVHELAHYITECDDGSSCHHTTMEIIAGMLGEVVIMMINKLMM